MPPKKKPTRAEIKRRALLAIKHAQKRILERRRKRRKRTHEPIGSHLNAMHGGPWQLGEKHGRRPLLRNPHVKNIIQYSRTFPVPKDVKVFTHVLDGVCMTVKDAQAWLRRNFNEVGVLEYRVVGLKHEL